MLRTAKVNRVAGDETGPLYACQDHFKMTQMGLIMRQGVFHSETKKNNTEDFRPFLPWHVYKWHFYFFLTVKLCIITSVVSAVSCIYIWSLQRSSTKLNLMLSHVSSFVSPPGLLFTVPYFETIPMTQRSNSHIWVSKAAIRCVTLLHQGAIRFKIKSAEERKLLGVTSYIELNLSKKTEDVLLFN